MKHATTARYPAPSETVIRMFTDEGYHARKLEKLGIEYEILAHEFDGEDFRLKARRAVPVQAGGLAGRMMPATTQVVNDERWRVSDKTGSVVVEPSGVPLEMSCSARMRDQDGECVVEYDWDIRARIPVGGGSLEKFVIADMENRAADELEAALSLLDEYR